MTSSNDNNIVYAPVTLDFVTIGVEFCSFLEKMEVKSRTEWAKTMLRILPLLYVKATLLPSVEVIGDQMAEVFVKEQDYMLIANQVASVLAEEDVYLDVFVEDMKYSDRPVSSFVSEDIADIYQDIRNFVSVYQHGLEETMVFALNDIAENFRAYWGQKLVNVLRPLHALVYKPLDDINLDHTIGEEDIPWV
ncbi:MAG TPA: DUF5063 domain-containing protein [Dysgonamonadaceae bacterium]|jgi:hypothetical protein|nr:DUF5063 domain-containing protein [Bacteroidales bacterium]HKM44945.1 DUF5063 domain-containing protein [Dysgonamonadaceae bacterium]